MKLAYQCKKIATAPVFNNFITGTILFASLLVGFTTYPEFYQNNKWTIDFLDKLVIGIFVLEAAIKILAEGKKPWRYFHDGWNIFDFTIIVACFIPAAGSYAAVFRLARVLRVLRLITALPKLQVLVGALITSIPSISYIGVLLFLHFYVYAVVGTLFFATNDPIHFGNLHLSLLSLFRVVTLEDWTDIMYIQMYGSAVYNPDQFFAAEATSQAFPLLSPLFFISFILLGTMIILNLFIGVIMNGMNEVEKQRSTEELYKRRSETKIVSIADEIQYLHSMLEDVREHVNLIDTLAEQVLTGQDSDNGKKRNSSLTSSQVTNRVRRPI